MNGRNRKGVIVDHEYIEKIDGIETTTTFWALRQLANRDVAIEFARANRS